MKVDPHVEELDKLSGTLREYMKSAIRGVIPKGRLLAAEMGITRNYQDNVLMLSLYVKIRPPTPKKWKKRRKKK